MRFKKYFLSFVLVMLALIVAACGSEGNENNASKGNNASQNNEQNQENTDDATSDLEGSVVIDGSGTVYPLMAKLAEEYMINEQENVSVEVSRSGTSAGFEKFLVENGTDFNDASRQIKEEEQATADELGIEVKEFKVALDGLTFVIHPDNDWATELTEEQLISIFHADGGITKWSDLDPSFPDEEIQTYGPNANHGTYEFFWENILEKADLVDTINLQ